MGSSSSHSVDTVADSISPNHDILNGKVAIVTGPTNGIGYDTARVLAKHGAHVVLAARNVTKAEECKKKMIEEIKAELPDAQPQFSIIHLDLASLASVHTAANEFLYTGLPLHLLINNAGVFTLKGKYEETVDGYELHVGSNHLGHYYFTRLLLPKLRSTASAEFPAKIVNVSSALHHPKLTNVEDIEKTFVNAQKHYSDAQAYNRSKLYNIYHAQTLARSEATHNVLAFSLHPGVVSTNIFNGASLIFSLFIKIFSTTVMLTPKTGAATTIHCALGESKENSGKYFTKCTVAKTSAIGTDEKLREKLIEVSERLIIQFQAKRGIL